MFDSLLGKIWGELPSSFGYAIENKKKNKNIKNSKNITNEKCDGIFEMFGGTKKSDGAPVTIFMHSSKNADGISASYAKKHLQRIRSLRHPNILRVFDTLECDDGRIYLVTEECDYLLDAKIPGDISWCMHQIVTAMSFLNEDCHLTHSILSPLSIFVTPNGDWRLSGFECCERSMDRVSMEHIGELRNHKAFKLHNFMPLYDNAFINQLLNTPSIFLDRWGLSGIICWSFAVSSCRLSSSSSSSSLAGSSHPSSSLSPSSSFGLPNDEREEREERDACHDAFYNRKFVPKNSKGEFEFDPKMNATHLPKSIQTLVHELQQPKSCQNKLSDVIKNHPYFSESNLVHVMIFLKEISLKGNYEKEIFFQKLPSMLDELSPDSQVNQILPEILRALEISMPHVPLILPCVIHIGKSLNEKEYKKNILPKIISLFQSSDRLVRLSLLNNMNELHMHMDEKVLQNDLIDQLAVGFSDSSAHIREATVKSMIYFIPKIKKTQQLERLIRLMCRSSSDPEAAIRTNTTICFAKIAQHIPPHLAPKALMQAFTSSLNDNFVPCRTAGLQALVATWQIFDVGEVSTKLLPLAATKLSDPSLQVREVAFCVLENLLAALKPLLLKNDQANVSEEGQKKGVHTSSSPSLSQQEKESGWLGAVAGMAFSVGSSLGKKALDFYGTRPNGGTGEISATNSSMAAGEGVTNGTQGQMNSAKNNMNNSTASILNNNNKMNKNMEEHDPNINICEKKNNYMNEISFDDDAFFDAQDNSSDFQHPHIRTLNNTTLSVTEKKPAEDSEFDDFDDFDETNQKSKSSASLGQKLTGIKQSSFSRNTQKNIFATNSVANEKVNVHTSPSLIAGGGGGGGKNSSNLVTNKGGAAIHSNYHNKPSLSTLTNSSTNSLLLEEKEKEKEKKSQFSFSLSNERHKGRVDPDDFFKEVDVLLVDDNKQEKNKTKTKTLQTIALKKSMFSSPSSNDGNIMSSSGIVTSNSSTIITKSGLKNTEGRTGGVEGGGGTSRLNKLLEKKQTLLSTASSSLSVNTEKTKAERDDENNEISTTTNAWGDEDINFDF